MKAKLLAAALAAGIAASAAAAEFYKVSLTRKDQDFYEVMGQRIFIKTRYCYEYVYGDEAIVRIDAGAGAYTMGKVIFSNGNSCDVAMILRG